MDGHSAQHKKEIWVILMAILGRKKNVTMKKILFLPKIHFWGHLTLLSLLKIWLWLFFKLSPLLQMHECPILLKTRLVFITQSVVLALSLPSCVWGCVLDGCPCKENKTFSKWWCLSENTHLGHSKVDALILIVKF